MTSAGTWWGWGAAAGPAVLLSPNSIAKIAGPSGAFSMGGGAVLGAGVSVSTSLAATVTFGVGAGAEAGFSPQWGTSSFIPACDYSRWTMNDQQDLSDNLSDNDYRRLVSLYHGLPVIAAYALIGVFMAVFVLTANVLVSSIAAAIPSLLLLWRWVGAGRQLDQVGCPKCGNRFPGGMYWKHPPKICPSCLKRLDR